MLVILKEKQKIQNLNSPVSRKVVSFHERIAKLQNHYRFSSDESKALQSYTALSSPLNSYLLHSSGVRHAPDSETYKDRHESDIANLDGLLKKHRTPDDMIVHTSVGYNHPIHRATGHFSMTSPAFTSTSLKHSVAMNHAVEGPDGYKHIVSIHVPKGSGGAYIDHHSVFKGEHEFLMNRNAVTRVHPVPIVDETTKTKTWRGQLVDDGVIMESNMLKCFLGFGSKLEPRVHPSYKQVYAGFVDKIKEYEKGLRRKALIAKGQLPELMPVKEDVNQSEFSHAWLSHYYPYNSEESKIIRDFSKDNSEINAHHLRKAGVKEHTGGNDYEPDPMELVHHEKTAKKMDGILRKHKAPTNFVVHTALGDSPIEHYDGESKYIKLHLPAYTSTSTQRSVAHGHALSSTDKGGYSHIVSLHIPAGSHGGYIANHTWNPHEMEYLLNKGAKVHLHPRPDVHFSKRVIQWHGRLVHDGVSYTKYAKE